MARNEAFDIAFSQISHVREEQAQTSVGLDGKIMALFAVGTALAGIGVPIGLSMAAELEVGTVKLIALPVTPYLLLFIGSIVGLWPSRFRAHYNPIELRKGYGRDPHELKEKLWDSINIAYGKNKAILNRKAFVIFIQAILLFAEAVCISVWAAYLYSLVLPD